MLIVDNNLAELVGNSHLMFLVIGVIVLLRDPAKVFGFLPDILYVILNDTEEPYLSNKLLCGSGGIDDDRIDGVSAAKFPEFEFLLSGYDFFHILGLNG
ncbi:hypothetical protein [Kallipyga massiliensis]|uniref:hypothetical protein n=1 Tax=Kallipyga massiliensis TaxID=1472764 RepID=UPI00055C0AB6|nr:hypothetical protein [Kallipyga massiliensis]